MKNLIAVVLTAVFVAVLFVPSYAKAEEIPERDIRKEAMIITAITAATAVSLIIMPAALVTVPMIALGMDKASDMNLNSGKRYKRHTRSGR